MAARLTIVNVPFAQARIAAADAAVREALTHAPRVARILPNGASAERTMQRLADAGTPALGVETTTLEAWALGRWSLYGDGRSPVAPAQRRAAAIAALDTTPCSLLKTQLKGMASCLEGVVRQASGTQAYANASEHDPRLSPAQQELLAVCRTYGRILTEHGLVEPGEAAALLPQAMGSTGWAHLVIDGPLDLSEPQVALVAAAAAHEGVTVVAQLGENPAFEAMRTVVARIEAVCRAAGVPVERRTVAATENPTSPWTSPEIAELAQRLFSPPAGAPIEPRGDVGFCLPSGRYAEPELLARTLRGLVAEGHAPRSIAVACKHPLELADSVASRLAETPGRAITCFARGSVPVLSTNVGRLLLTLEALVGEERASDAPAPWLRDMAADVARNPLADLPTQVALELDCVWRKNRLMGASAFLADISRAAAEHMPQPGIPTLPDPNGPVPEPLVTWASLAQVLTADAPAGDVPATEMIPQEPAPLPPICEAIEAMREGDIARAAEALVAPLSPAGVVDRKERAAAASIARIARATQELLPPDQPLPPLERLLGSTAVPVSWVSVSPSDVAAQRQAAVLDGNPNAVEFCTLAQLDGRAFDAVVVCDLTAEAFSVADRSDSQAAFLEALGCSPATPTLQSLRRQMRAALESARSRVVFERCLQDPEAKALRPSALFEEIVDCYRPDPTAIDDLDRTTGLPKDGRLSYETMGEERFSLLASPVTWTPATLLAPVPAVVPTSDEALARMANPERLWSPAELETYLSCPLRWFYERQVPSDTPDVTFGPREEGSFSRQVLTAFHEALAAMDIQRVGGKADQTLWGPVLDECFDKVLASQEGADRPLIPTTSLEWRRLDALRRNLQSCAERDALLPSGFAPKRHQWTFGEPDAITYGGVKLRGAVHRIDEDDQGRALIIDYKGAVGNNGYSVPRPKRATKNKPPEPVDPLPQHCQVLMYASALQKANPGTRAVGAIYISYNRNRAQGFLDTAIAGKLAASGSYLDEKNLVEPAEDGSSGFQNLLSYVEGEVASAMDRLRSGDVSPRPRFGANSCEHCTVNSCPRKKAK